MTTGCLRLAAYNSGEGNVRYSMRKNIKGGQAARFLLTRPVEGNTSLRTATAGHQRHQSQTRQNTTSSLLPIANEPYWEMVDTGSQLDLSVAAEIAAEISIDELYLLNPAFNKWSTHPDGPHELLVPLTTGGNVSGQPRGAAPGPTATLGSATRSSQARLSASSRRRYNTSVEPRCNWPTSSKGT